MEFSLQSHRQLVTHRNQSWIEIVIMLCMPVIDGLITAVQTLVSTSICGIIQSILGGQPLLIVGVSEPTSLVYTFMFNFAKQRSQLGPALFLPWVGW